MLGIPSDTINLRSVFFLNYYLLSVPDFHTSNCDLVCFDRIMISKTMMLTPWLFQWNFLLEKLLNGLW